MKLIAVGDNTVDCYLDQRKFYPGGNAVNVAVNCKRNGAEACGYLGIFGDDPEAEHIKRALTQEGVSYERSRKAYGISGHPQVNLTPQGERVFVGGPTDTVQKNLRLRLIKEDLDYIKKFDLVHTSCFSNIEPELAAIKECADISYDFSVFYSNEYLDLVCPHIKYAFFSSSRIEKEKLDIETDRIIKRCHSHGVEIVGITLGAEGSLFSDGTKRYIQGIKPVNAIDTMGAGDSFIAGFLTAFTQGKPMEEALDYAAGRAAQTCTFYGGFGYPMDFIE